MQVTIEYKCTTTKELQKSEASSALQVLMRTHNPKQASDHAHKKIQQGSSTHLTAC